MSEVKLRSFFIKKHIRIVLLKKQFLRFKYTKKYDWDKQEGASLLQFLLSSLQCYCGLKKNARTKSSEKLNYFIVLE